MKQIERLIERIIKRVNINLRAFQFDVTPYMHELVSHMEMLNYNAFYGITEHHPTHFVFSKSSIAGSYFFGKCVIEQSTIYDSDIRGDELKRAGDHIEIEGDEFIMEEDEMVRILDSYLIKTLVHSFSHDPRSPEEFFIRNTVSMHYANIHGAPMVGCFLGPLATVDLTTARSCIFGAYSYVQTGTIMDKIVERGVVWVKSNSFEFLYRYPRHVIDHYIHYIESNTSPVGVLMDFCEQRKEELRQVFYGKFEMPMVAIPNTSAMNRYALIKGNTSIGDNVLIAQRAYLQDAHMGQGSNAQENSYIICSRLEGNDVTAHGAKIIHTHLGNYVFVGFNSFLHGKPDMKLIIEDHNIIMPHTIIDLEEPLHIPSNQLVWGYIRNRHDLAENSISLDKLCTVDGKISQGNMVFDGKGEDMVTAFKIRIKRILEQNYGHAEVSQDISYYMLQPYLSGKQQGLFPSIEINP
ncbi:MAG: transferase [Desulfobacterales bacterium]|nr:transferase [Desulfobacterales bacterium]